MTQVQSIQKPAPEQPPAQEARAKARTTPDEGARFAPALDRRVTRQERGGEASASDARVSRESSGTEKNDGSKDSAKGESSNETRDGKSEKGGDARAGVEQQGQRRAERHEPNENRRGNARVKDGTSGEGQREGDDGSKKARAERRSDGDGSRAAQHSARRTAPERAQKRAPERAPEHAPERGEARAQHRTAEQAEGSKEAPERSGEQARQKSAPARESSADAEHVKSGSKAEPVKPDAGKGIELLNNVFARAQAVRSLSGTSAPEAGADVLRMAGENGGRPVEAQAMRGIGAVLEKGGGTVTLRLSPETLGALKVSMQMQGSAVTVNLETTTNEAHRLIERSIEMLKTTLEQKGVKVERVQVQMASSETVRHSHGVTQSQQSEGRDGESDREHADEDEQGDQGHEHDGYNHDGSEDGNDGEHAGYQGPVEDFAQRVRIALDTSA